MMHQYISKDYVIWGSLIALDSAPRIWRAMDGRVRTSVKKGEKMNVRIRPFDVARDLEAVRSLTPNADDIPSIFESRHHAFVAEAVENGKTLGWILLAGIRAKLFMLCHASTPEGKRRQTPNLLIWHAIQSWCGGPYAFLDVGASYRPSLQRYFAGFRDRTYPLILRPLDVKPLIRFLPFETASYGAPLGTVKSAREHLTKWLGTSRFMFLPRPDLAFSICLQEWLAQGVLRRESRILVIGDDAKRMPNRTWQDIPDIGIAYEDAKDVGAVLVRHNGIRHPELPAWRAACTSRGIPLIEDASQAWGADGVGCAADASIYSAAHAFPVPFGAFLTGHMIPFDRLWQTYACADSGKEDEVLAMIDGFGLAPSELADRRRQVWASYRAHLQSVFGDGVASPDGSAPWAFPLDLETEDNAERLACSLERFGIETAREGSHVLLPCHPWITPRHLAYVCGAVLANFRDGCGF